MIWKIVAWISAAAFVGLLLHIATRDDVISVKVSVTMARPMIGVQVKADSVLQGETDSTGNLVFEVEKKNGEWVDVSFEKEGYKGINSVFQVVDSEKSFYNVELEAIHVEMALEIEVQNQYGTPLPDRQVILLSEDQEELGKDKTGSAGNWKTTVYQPLGARLAVVVNDSQRTVVVGKRPQKVIVSLELGLPVEFTTINGIEGVEIYLGTQRLAITDEKGWASTIIPPMSDGTIITFRLPDRNVQIEEWTITPDQMQTGGKLTYRIKVRPAGDVVLKVQASMVDFAEYPVAGYEVWVNTDRVGQVDEHGYFETPLANVLIGDRLSIVVKGEEGTGRGGIIIIPEQMEYEIGISIVVLSYVEIQVKGRSIDGEEEALEGASVSLRGESHKTDGTGVVSFEIDRLGVRYDFSFEANTYLDTTMSIIPSEQYTTDEMLMEQRYFRAMVVDSLTNEGVRGVDLFYRGKLIASLLGAPEIIPISGLGEHEFEFRSLNPRYPNTQEKSVRVEQPGERITIRLMPNPVEITLHVVLLTEGGPEPVRGRKVDLRCPEQSPERKTTDRSGEATFTGYQISLGSECEAELILSEGRITTKPPIKVEGYKNKYEWKISLGSEVHITTTPGHEDAELKLYRSRSAYVTGGAPLYQGIGKIDADGVPYGSDYFLWAQGDTTAGGTVVTYEFDIDIPNICCMVVDPGDPFPQCDSLYSSGNEEEAMSFCEEVTSSSGRENYGTARAYMGLFKLKNERFGDAADDFDDAIEDGFIGENPSIYLGAAQANHGVGRWDKCRRYARDASRNMSKWAMDIREKRRYLARYMEVMCFHDEYFGVSEEERSGRFPEGEERKATLGKIRFMWENYIENTPVEYQRDALTRQEDVMIELTK
jgi:hypothetical protein